MKAISSKNSHVVIDNVAMLATKWTVEIRADEIDVTTFESFGFTQQLPGFIDATITFDAFWDCDSNIFLDPPEITVGSVHELKCYIKGPAVGGEVVPVGAAVAPLFFSFPCALCITADVTSAVRDAVRYNCTFRNNGPFLYPDASDAIASEADCVECGTSALVG